MDELYVVSNVSADRRLWYPSACRTKVTRFARRCRWDDGASGRTSTVRARDDDEKTARAEDEFVDAMDGERERERARPASSSDEEYEESSSSFHRGTSTAHHSPNTHVYYETTHRTPPLQTPIKPIKPINTSTPPTDVSTIMGDHTLYYNLNTSIIHTTYTITNAHTRTTPSRVAAPRRAVVATTH